MVADNIAAIATGAVASGVAVIRISGTSPLNIAKQCFSPSGKTKVEDFIPNKMYVGEILADGFCDFGLCVYFKAPHSFTGEDVVEFHSHGGTAITRGILKKILSLGARLADKGEFTRRAFMNGKLSLSSAEGLIDMINSETEGGVKAGYYLYRERLTKEVVAMQDRLTEALAEIDADIDYPEEDLEVNSMKASKEAINYALEKIDGLLKTFKQGRVLKNGVKVGIVGKPNVGKSSLFNALLDYDKAIVSEVAGTTRDVVEGSIDIKGIRFNFSDTAGIRESEDKIEVLGVQLSRRVLEESDILLFVLDGSNKTKEDDSIYNLLKDKNSLTVLNKSDMGDFLDERADILLSAKEKSNIEDLKELLYQKTVGDSLDLNGDFLCEQRHYEALLLAKEKLIDAKEGLNIVSLDLVAIDIKSSWDYLGEISGKTASEDIIDAIFSKFCVGK